VATIMGIAKMETNTFYPELIIITLLMFSGLVLIAWLIERLSKYVRLILPRLFPDYFRRREEHIRRRVLIAYDPDWVLERLFSEYRQKFSFTAIMKILADCAPHDRDVWGDGYASFFWFWILEVRPIFRHNQLYGYAYVAGFFDPRLLEPLTILKSWLFQTPEEAAMCALKSMEFHPIYKLKPHQELYESLLEQVQKGRRKRQAPF
jgi:hypothetical protein